MHIKPYELLYMALIGSLVYSLLEVAARGFTHWTMTVTGGFLAIVLYLMNWHAPPHTRLLQYITGAIMITAVEMLVGVADNLILHWNVWDYTDMPLNLYGQICLPFMILFACLCAVGIYLSANILHLLYGEDKPQFVRKTILLNSKYKCYNEM